MLDDCLFCNIASGKIPSEIVYEDEYVMAFKDINPVAPVHILVIPKKHIVNINELDDENILYASKCMLAMKKIAQICGVAEDGYRVVSNIGENGGQAVLHLHFHLLGGTKLGEKIV